MATESIKEIQHYLRTLSFRNSSIMPLVVDGIYGHDTAKAVSSFQQLTDLPVSGEVDLRTWNTLVNAYNRDQSEPLLLAPFSDKNTVIDKTSPKDTILILQTLLMSLAVDNPRLPSGVFDDDTIQQIQVFQTSQQLPVTGVVDLYTWNTMASLYNERRFLQARFKE